MRSAAAAGVVGVAVLSCGCALATDAAHVTVARMNQAVEDAREWRRDQELAAAAWDEIRCGPGGAAYSGDYADGFTEGFASHLFRGTTEPPPVPPQRYRSVANQSPQGYRAATDWLNGYRRGVDVALARGLRQYMTGPSSLRVAANPPGGPASPQPAPVHLPWQFATASLPVEPASGGPGESSDAPPAAAAPAPPEGDRSTPEAAPTPPRAGGPDRPPTERTAPPPSADPAAVNPVLWSKAAKPLAPASPAAPAGDRPNWRAAGESRP